MARRWIRYVKWCTSKGEKPVWGCHILPDTFMRIKLVSACVMLLFLIGCGTPNVALFDSSVQVFHEGQRPDRPYREIGELTKEYFTGEDAVVLADFVKQAHAHHADAIIVLPGRDVGYQFNPFGRSGNRYVWRAAMIVWEPGQGTQPVTPASSSTHLDAKPL